MNRHLFRRSTPFFRTSMVFGLVILVIAVINILLLHNSVPETVRNEYPELKKPGNILYYSFMPFLAILPLASFLLASLLALIPFRHYRYTQKLWPVFLAILFIFEAVALAALLAKYR